jgi:hypothetical protein
MKKVSNLTSLVNSRLPGIIWEHDLSSIGWIKHQQDLLNGGNLLGIKSVLLGQETVSDQAIIQRRSPTHRDFILAQLAVKYNDLVKQSTAQNIAVYNEDPTAVYEHKAILDGIAAANLVIDNTLLDVLIPPVLANSINIPPAIRERFNIKMRGATSAADKKKSGRRTIHRKRQRSNAVNDPNQDNSKIVC